MSSLMSEDRFQELKNFFAREVCQKATAPLRSGTEVAVYVGDEGPVALRKDSSGFGAIDIAPTKPDMTFWVGEKGLKELVATTTADVGEIGVEILKLMAHSDSEHKIKAKVHIGAFDLLRHGYLSVLPLGGATVMKFLGSKGFGSIGKIKDALSRMRN